MADEEKKEKDQKSSSTQNKEKDQKSSSNSTNSMDSILEKMETMSLELADLRAKKEQENHPVPAIVSPTRWWEDKTKAILAMVLTVVVLFFATMSVKDWYDHQLRLSYDAGWQAGKSNGIDAAKKQWEDTAWYSRWWNAIKGTYPE